MKISQLHGHCVILDSQVSENLSFLKDSLEILTNLELICNSKIVL